jgi:hypothetical protein
MCLWRQQESRSHAILTDKEIKSIVLVHSPQHRDKCGSCVGRSPVYSRSRQLREHRGKSNIEVLGGKKSYFSRFFGDFVTSFASSRLASVTRDIREFGGL